MYVCVRVAITHFQVGRAKLVTETGSFDAGGNETGADILLRTIEDENRDTPPSPLPPRKSKTKT